MDETVIVNFGAGVQSTAIAMLAIEKNDFFMRTLDGRLPKHWIFADTGDETAETYRHLEFMRERLEAEGFVLHVVVNKPGLTLSQHVLSGEKGGVSLPPFFVADKSGGYVPVMRCCTKDYKVRPIKRLINKLHGRKYREEITQVFGISADEAQRMREPDKQSLVFKYPLVSMGWKRSHCQSYLRDMGIRAPRSSCRYCPFHRNDEWRRIKSQPEEWAKTVQFERDVHALYDKQGLAGLKTKPYLHSSRVPIDEIDFDAQIDLFTMDDECAGVCGV